LIKAARKILTKRIEELIVALGTLLTRAIQEADFVLFESSLLLVALGDMLDFIDVVLFLQIFLHEVFVLE